MQILGVPFPWFLFPIFRRPDRIVVLRISFTPSPTRREIYDGIVPVARELGENLVMPNKACRGE
jgi:hypothetical protein